MLVYQSCKGQGPQNVKSMNWSHMLGEQEVLADSISQDTQQGATTRRECWLKMGTHQSCRRGDQNKLREDGLGYASQVHLITSESHSIHPSSEGSKQRTPITIPSCINGLPS